jgi:hypothetical protein
MTKAKENVRDAEIADASRTSGEVKTTFGFFIAL